MGENRQKCCCTAISRYTYHMMDIYHSAVESSVQGENKGH